MSDIGKIIDGISEHIVNEQWILIDHMLNGIDLNQSTAILLTYARATFPIRQKLSKWKMAIENIEDEFKRRGLEHERLLKGLINES